MVSYIENVRKIILNILLELRHAIFDALLNSLCSRFAFDVANGHSGYGFIVISINCIKRKTNILHPIMIIIMGR